MQLSPAWLLEYSGILEIHCGDGFRDWLHSGILPLSTRVMDSETGCILEFYQGDGFGDWLHFGILEIHCVDGFRDWLHSGIPEIL